MAVLTIDLWTCDVGAPADSPQAYAAQIISRVQQSWDSGADVVVFPEYTWMGLEQFVEGKEKLQGVSNLFWQDLWPEMQQLVAREDKLVVLGTVPWRDATTDQICNRAPVLGAGQSFHQDKLHLTPWETVFTAGKTLHLFKFQGLTFAVVICLDIEVPELSVALRGRGVDCLLVPSATESVLGVERVGRCASARSVELGCHVGVAHLVGKTTSELVDENVGRLAWFRPSQSPFAEVVRETLSPISQEGFHSLRCHLDLELLQKLKGLNGETNPAQLTLPDHGVSIVSV
jgi:predicted amidohydrolase